MRLIAVILVVAFSGAAVGQDFGGHALFVRTPDADPGKKNAKGLLRVRSAKERGHTVVLRWQNTNLITNEWFEIH